MKTLEEWCKEYFKFLLDKSFTKLEAEVKEGSLTAYWAGSIIRIDVKPKNKTI